MTNLIRILLARARLLMGIGIGLVAVMMLPVSMRMLSRWLVGWDIGCGVYLVLIAIMFSRKHETSIAVDAEHQQTGEWTTFWLTVVGVIASFAAILGEFSTSKDLPASARGEQAALVAATLLLSWTLTHTLFALRYAHEYYERKPNAREFDKGLIFPDDAAPDYWDFFYFAIVLGMTFQVSDVQINSRKLRRLATVHGLLSFLFNTTILALSVNIGASLL